MPLTKEEVRAKLTEMGIKFEVMEHGPVYTIDEMKLIEGMKIEDVCKNLFLRDDRGKRHFLVVLDEAKSADLKAIRAQIGSSRLSFAVLMDEDLRGRPRLGVHPCDNTETLWLSAADIEKIIKSRGNSLKFIKI